MKKHARGIDSILVRMYKLLNQEFGKYSRDTFSLTGGVSPSLPRIDEDAVYQRVYQQMLNEGFTLDTPPSSADALKQQVSFATTKQDPNKYDLGQFKIQRQSRIAAYEAGFMSWEDVRFLDKVVD